MTLQREVKAATYTTKWIAIKYHGDGRDVNTWAKWKSSESIPQFSFRMHLQPNLWWIKRDPFRCLPYKRTIACSFSWDKQKRLSRSRRMCKKKDLFRYSELIKLLSITETLLLLTPAWKMKCSEAFAALETGVPGRGGGEGVQGTHHLPVCTACTLCLGYGHSLSLKYEGYKTLKIWGL